LRYNYRVICGFSLLLGGGKGALIRVQLALRSFKIGIWGILLPAQPARYLRGKCMLLAWCMHGGVGLAGGVVVRSTFDQSLLMREAGRMLNISLSRIQPLAEQIGVG